MKWRTIVSSVTNKAFWALLATLLWIALAVAGLSSAHAQSPQNQERRPNQVNRRGDLKIAQIEIGKNYPALAGVENTVLVTLQVEGESTLAINTMFSVSLDGEPIIELWYDTSSVVSETVEIPFITPWEPGPHALLATTRRIDTWRGDNETFFFMVIVPGPWSTDFYSMDSPAVQEGDLISVWDPNGVLCGEIIARSEGSFGMLHVYGDDLTTPEIDEGAEEGNLLTWQVNGWTVKNGPKGEDILWEEKTLKGLSLSWPQIESLSILPRTAHPDQAVTLVVTPTFVGGDSYEVGIKSSWHQQIKPMTMGTTFRFYACPYGIGAGCSPTQTIRISIYRCGLYNAPVAETTVDYRIIGQNNVVNVPLIYNPQLFSPLGEGE